MARLVEVIGVENAFKALVVFGGESIKFPTLDSVVSNMGLAAAVVAVIDGADPARVARDHKLDVGWITEMASAVSGKLDKSRRDRVNRTQETDRHTIWKMTQS